MKFTSLLLLGFLASCQNKKILPENLMPFLERGGSSFLIWKSIPEAETRIENPKQVIELHFNENISKETCRKAVRFSEPIPFSLQSHDRTLVWSPEKEISDGAHQLTVTTICENAEGKNLSKEYILPISVSAPPKPKPIPPEPVVPPPPPPVPPPPTPPIPEPIIPLRILAIGVSSQNCGGKYPEKGSSTGGDWLANSCYWDESLKILGSNKYRFRGGDSGLGAFGSTEGCADITTDNFVLQFSESVSVQEIWEKVKLEKINPPSTIVRLARVLPAFCEGSSETLCKQFTLIFAEQEATCNGSLFGRLQDLNLGETRFSGEGESLYRITIPRSLQSELKRSLKEDFKFLVEGR